MQCSATTVVAQMDIGAPGEEELDLAGTVDELYEEKEKNSGAYRRKTT